jgi:hypothetical protein
MKAKLGQNAGDGRRLPVFKLNPNTQRQTPRLNQLIQPPDYRSRSILVRHHYGDGGLWIVNVECDTSSA